MILESPIRSSVLASVLVLAPALCLANPLILFHSGSEDGLDTPRLLQVPQQGVVQLEALAGACNLGRGGGLRAYDLASGDCTEAFGPGVPAAHQPSLDQPLQGSVLEGQPVQVALDDGLFVWYDLRTSRACVIGACLRIVGISSPVLVSIDSFTATPDVIEIDEQTVLSWASTAATGCTLSDDQGGAPEPVPTTGSTVRSPLSTTLFSLSCQNGGSSDSENVTVTVTNSFEIIFLDGFESD